MSHACFTQSMTIITAYDTLGEEGLVHALTENQIQVIFTNEDLLPMISKVAIQLPDLRHVIYNGNSTCQIPEDLKAQKKIQLLSLTELHDLGLSNVSPHTPPEPSSLACIMYTSG